MTTPDERDLFEIFPDPANRIGIDRLIVAQNRASREQFGERVGEPCHVVHFGREDRCPGCLAAEVLARGRVERWFLPCGGGPGEPGTSYYEITAIPLLDSGGAPTGYIEIRRDVTAALGVEYHLMTDAERLGAENDRLAERAAELQAQIRELLERRAAALQTQKLASIGRLAAGVAHEIHTPLAAISSALDLLRRRYERDAAALDDCRQPLELLGLAVERIRRIAGSLREFAHLDRAELESVDPHHGIEAALALLAHEMRGRIDVVRDFGAIPHVTCRPDAMNQVWMNLLQNAVQAIDGPGTITITTKGAGDGTVTLAFADTGRGIAPENLERIFEPGFTSKPRGIGTGLGLAIVHRTVTEHGGTIDVESEVGRGTTFTVTIPVRPGR